MSQNKHKASNHHAEEATSLQAEAARQQTLLPMRSSNGADKNDDTDAAARANNNNNDSNNSSNDNDSIKSLISENGFFPVSEDSKERVRLPRRRCEAEGATPNAGDENSTIRDGGEQAPRGDGEAIHRATSPTVTSSVSLKTVTLKETRGHYHGASDTGKQDELDK